MESPDFHLVQWPLLPSFIQEACVVFLFESSSEAQGFSDLLMARMRGLLSRVQQMKQSLDDPQEYVTEIEREFVCSHSSLHCFYHIWGT